jgi:hypothetical protein
MWGYTRKKRKKEILGGLSQNIKEKGDEEQEQVGLVYNFGNHKSDGVNDDDGQLTQDSRKYPGKEVNDRRATHHAHPIPDLVFFLRDNLDAEPAAEKREGDG